MLATVKYKIVPTYRSKKRRTTTLFQRNQIWVSCQGENPADVESITSNLNYFPTRGFPYYYYPYTNIEGYLSPLVAVQVTHPRSMYPKH